MQISTSSENFPVLTLAEESWIIQRISETHFDRDFSVQEKVLELLAKDPEGKYALQVIRTWISAGGSGKVPKTEKNLMHSTICAYALRDISRRNMASIARFARLSTLEKAIAYGSPWEREICRTEYENRARRWLTSTAYNVWLGAFSKYEGANLEGFLKESSHIILKRERKYNEMTNERHKRRKALAKRYAKR